jgi:hypothetical protein
MPKTKKTTGTAKRYPLNMRTTKEIRERLEGAAAKSGRSLAQEVEYRLERSFAKEDEARTRELMEKIDAHFTRLQEQGYDVRRSEERKK